MVVGFGFFGHAGTKKDHPDVLAVGPTQHPAMGQQGREQRGQVGDQIGHVAANEIHCRRAGRGELQPRATFGQDTGHGGRDFLGAQGCFRHPGKSELSQGGDHGFGGDVGKFRHPRWGQGHVRRALGTKQLVDGKQVATHLLGMGRTGRHALAAGNAQFRHNRGPAPFHLDGLDRALAQAAIAVLAFGFDSINGIMRKHVASRKKGFKGIAGGVRSRQASPGGEPGEAGRTNAGVPPGMA